MASQRIEEIMRNVSAKDQAAFKDSVQQLKDNQVQHNTKPGFEALPPTDPANAQAKQGKLGTIAPNETAPDQSQRGVQLIQQKMAESQKSKAVNHAKDVVKDNAPQKNIPER